MAHQTGRGGVGGEGGARTNGTTLNKNNNNSIKKPDIYKQLIDNDMVKELDDIEAISQQISQHAEVLYNSWKNKGGVVSQQTGPGGTSPPSDQHQSAAGAYSSSISSKPSSSAFHQHNPESVSPSLGESKANPLGRDLRERGGTSSPSSNTVINGGENNGFVNRVGGSVSSFNHPSFNTRPSGYRNGEQKIVKIKFPSEGYGSLNRQHQEPCSPLARQGFSTNSLDRHGFDRQQKQHDQQQRPHTLDRVVQRNSSSSSSYSSPTSSTRESPSKGSSITQISSPPATDVGPLELLASPNLSGNLEELVTSFVSTDRAKQAARNTISSTIMRRLGSPAPSSTGSLPVRSPSPTPSLNFRDASSPLRSPMLTNSVRVNSPDPASSSPKPSIANMFPSDIMIPINNSQPFVNNNEFIHAPMQSIFSKQNDQSLSSSVKSLNPTSPVKSPTPPPRSLDDTDSIPIPVKVINSPSSSQGLKSPSVLQSANKNPFTFPTVSKTDTIDQPMPNLFDQFGAVKDPDESLKAMRRRFEEAKQRMALSLPAREGGLRPNSLIARSMFENDKMLSNSPWGDDPSSFLLDQLRRRNKRRMESPAAPHPELTPQQKQHIFERTSVPSTLQPGAPMRRMLPGGSVAERVLMFEKSPSIFGMEPIGGSRTAAAAAAAQRREPTLAGTALAAPWRSQAHEQQKQVSHYISF